MDWWEWKFEDTGHIGEDLFGLNQLVDRVKVAARNLVNYKRDGKRAEALIQEESHFQKSIEAFQRASLEKLKQTTEHIISNYSLEVIETNSENYVKEVESVINSIIKLRKKINNKMKELEKLLAREDPVLINLAQSFNEAVDNLENEASRITQIKNLTGEQRVRVPWEFKYRLLQAEGEIPMEGGYITNAEGERINEEYCTLCSSVLQQWEVGKNVERMRCIDVQIQRCVECHENVQAIESHLLASAEKMKDDKNLKNLIKKLFAIDFQEKYYEKWTRAEMQQKKGWIKEANILTFQREPIVDSIGNMLQLVFHASTIFSARPFIGNSIYSSKRSPLIEKLKQQSVNGKKYIKSHQKVEWITYSSFFKLTQMFKEKISGIFGGVDPSLPMGTVKLILLVDNSLEFLITYFSLSLLNSTDFSEVLHSHRFEIMLLPRENFVIEENQEALVFSTNAVEDSHFLAKYHKNIKFLFYFGEEGKSTSLDSFPIHQKFNLIDNAFLQENIEKELIPTNLHSFKSISDGEMSMLAIDGTSITKITEQIIFEKARVANFTFPLQFLATESFCQVDSLLPCWEMLSNGGKICFLSLSPSHIIQHAHHFIQCPPNAPLPPDHLLQFYFYTRIGKHRPPQFDVSFSSNTSLPLTFYPSSSEFVHAKCALENETGTLFQQTKMIHLNFENLSDKEIMQKINEYTVPCKLTTCIPTGKSYQLPEDISRWSAVVNRNALDGWIFQNHSDCAAAAFAGSLNALFKLKRSNDLIFTALDAHILFRSFSEVSLKEFYEAYASAFPKTDPPFLDSFFAKIFDQGLKITGDTSLAPISIGEFKKWLLSEFIPCEYFEDSADIISVFADIKPNYNSIFGWILRYKRLLKPAVTTSDQKISDIVDYLGLPVRGFYLPYHLYSWHFIKYLISRDDISLLIAVPHHLAMVFGATEEIDGSKRHLLIGRPAGGQSPSALVPFTYHDVDAGEDLWEDGLTEEEMGKGLVICPRRILVLQRTNKVLEAPLASCTMQTERPTWLPTCEYWCEDCISHFTQRDYATIQQKRENMFSLSQKQI